MEWYNQNREEGFLRLALCFLAVVVCLLLGLGLIILLKELAGLMEQSR